VADRGNLRIRRISLAKAKLTNDEWLVPSEDGGEAFVFGRDGRHRRTLDAVTGALLYTFQYTAEGWLASVTDGDGNQTVLERDGEGKLTAVVAPHGQRTVFTHNPEGLIESATNPKGEETRVTYYEGALLQSLTDAKGGTHHYRYDALGRLTYDEDPARGFKALHELRQNAQDLEVEVSTAEGRTTYYRLQRPGKGPAHLVRLNRFPDGSELVRSQRPDGRRHWTLPDKTTLDVVLGPDPRWGMRAPMVKKATVRTPLGRVATVTSSRQAVLARKGDPLARISHHESSRGVLRPVSTKEEERRTPEA